MMVHHPLQETCLAIITGTSILAAIFVALRIYTRRKLKLTLSWDDWCIVAASILSLALVVPSWKHVKMWHIGWHIWDVDLRHLEPNFNDYYDVLLAFQLLNIPILPLAKISILLLLLRGGGVIPWLKKTIYCILAFTIGSSLFPWSIYAFICRPLTGNTWNPRTFRHIRCIGRPMMGELLIWVTCANLITDILILPIPFIIVRRLMNARFLSKVAVLAAFVCGLAVTGISGVKIYLQYRDRIWGAVSPDWTYNINYCVSHIENNVAIILANIPILRSMVTRWILDFRAHSSAPEHGFVATHQLKTYNSNDFGRQPHTSRRSSFFQKAFLCEKLRTLSNSADANQEKGISKPASTYFATSSRVRTQSESQILPVCQHDAPGSFVAAYFRARGESIETDLERQDSHVGLSIIPAKAREYT